MLANAWRVEANAIVQVHRGSKLGRGLFVAEPTPALVDVLDSKSSRHEDRGAYGPAHSTAPAVLERGRDAV
jgi:hypothetical protein